MLILDFAGLETAAGLNKPTRRDGGGAAGAGRCSLQSVQSC